MRCSLASIHTWHSNSLEETKESLDNNTPESRPMSRAIGLLVPLTQCHSWRRTELLMKQIITNSSARLYLELYSNLALAPPIYPPGVWQTRLFLRKRHCKTMTKKTISIPISAVFKIPIPISIPTFKNTDKNTDYRYRLKIPIPIHD